MQKFGSHLLRQTKRLTNFDEICSYYENYIDICLVITFKNIFIVKNENNIHSELYHVIIINKYS